jgi:hypothetical protein
MATPFLPSSPTPLVFEVVTAQAGAIVLKARTVAELYPLAGLTTDLRRYRHAPEGTAATTTSNPSSNSVTGGCP